MRTALRDRSLAVALVAILLVSGVGSGIGFTGSVAGSTGESPGTNQRLQAETPTESQRGIAPVNVSVSDLPGDGTAANPYVITNASALQAIEDDLTAHYRLGSDIDATNTSSWNNGRGFNPIGGVDDKTNTPGSSFSGTFDGDGHTITGLTIDRPNEDYVGLFGNISSDSTIKAVTLTSVDITGNENVGGLVGNQHGGTIHNVTVAGTVTGVDAGTGGVPEYTGGVAGASTNGATIRDVTADVTVTGTVFVGGLTGATGDAVIQDVSATRDTHGRDIGLTNAEYVGGLVGLNDKQAVIRTASASGTVNGTDRIGGLVGWNVGTIRNVSASATVKGFLQIGGLVGLNTGTIERATASGDVYGNSSAGGLVAVNTDGRIENASARGAVTIREDGQNLSVDIAGGLVADNDGTIQDTFAVGRVSAQEPASNVTLGGLVAKNFITNSTGKHYGNIRDSYWDTQTTGQSASAGNATGLLTAQMTGESARTNMSGLTYGEVWAIQSNAYPILLDNPEGPTAAADAYTTPEDQRLVVSAPGVLTNDTDSDNDTLTAVLRTQPTNGSVTLNADGSFEYVPDSDFAGTDSFTYNASDGTLQDTATVTITVSGVNDTPTAATDSYTTGENSTLQIAAPGVLQNDVDPEGDELAATRVRGPTNGSLSLAANGSVTYTPNPGFAGTDSFTYNASDATGNSTATVTITVTPANDPPTAVNDTYRTAEDDPLTVAAPGVLGNDSDPNGDALNATRVRGPTNGSLTLNADGSFEYVPDSDFAGTDSFTYNASDGTATRTATVTVNVTAVDDTAPVLRNATAKEYTENSYTVRDGDEVVVRVNVSDPEQGTITAVTVDARGFGAGTVSLNETNVDGVYMGTFTVNASAVQDGAKLLQVTATDSAGNTAATTTGFPVTLDTQPPTAAVTANRTSITAGETVQFNVSGSTDNVQFGLSEHRWDFQSDGIIDFRTFFTFTETVTHTYTAAGTYTVNLTVSDQADNTDSTSVTINVAASDQSPVAAADSYQTPEDTPLRVTAPGVLGNDSDPNGDVLTVRRVSNPSHGALSLAENGSFVYTPAQNFTGTDSFTYNASDGTQNSTATVMVSVTGVNDTPVAANDRYTVSEHTDRNRSQLTVPAPGVLANDTDADGDSLHVTPVSGPTNGTLSLAANGSFTYTPTQSFVGTDAFTYNASDGSANSTATVRINVTGSNRAPAAHDDTYTTTENTTLQVSSPGVLDNDSDPDDGAVLTAAVTNGPRNGTLSLNQSGGFSYTPKPGFNGSDSFTYTASDGQLTDTATVTITVTSSTSSDTTAPTLSNPQLIDQTDGNGYVTHGDSVTVAVMVRDTGGSTGGTVSVDASAFGAGSVELTDRNRDGWFNATFRVDAATPIPDGTRGVVITAVDAAGNTNTTTTPSLVLDTTPPTPSITASATTVGVGDAITFEAVGSTDASPITTYAWDFGDGTTTTGQTVAHAYDAAGTYPVELTVTDAAGNVNTTTLSVSVEAATGGAPDQDPSSGTAPISHTATVANGPGWPTAHDDLLNTGNNSESWGPVTGVLERWTFQTAGSVTHGPAVVNGTVYVGSDDNTVYALNATTGAEAWNVSLSQEVSSTPTVVNDTVYVSSSSGTVYALVAATGSERWNHTLGGTDPTTPVVANGTVYVGAGDHNLTALNATSGAERWTFETGGILVSTPAVTNDTVYVGSHDNRLYAVNATTGVEQWNVTTGGAISAAPTVANGTVYVGSHDTSVYAVDARTGVQQWNYSTGGLVIASPAVANNTVYVGTLNDTVYALNSQTGAQQWTHTMPGAVFAAPGVVNGTVYVAARDGTVSGLAAASGTPVWTHSVGSQVTASPAIVAGSVYVGRTDGNVTAVSSTTLRPVLPDTPAIAGFEDTVSLSPDRVTPVSLAGKFRVERPFNGTASVELVRNTSTAYTLAIDVEGGAENVTFYLQERAISASQDIDNLTMYLDGEQHPFVVNESAGPGQSPWVAFNVPEFSTRTITFTTDSDSESAPPAPAIEAPPDDTYDPTANLTLGALYNATGVINTSDIGVVFSNATAGNGTVLETVVPTNESGVAEATLQAGALSGNVTVNTSLVNTTTAEVFATDVINLSADTGGETTPPAAPVIESVDNDTYDPSFNYTLIAYHNATGVIAPADVGVRLVNVTGSTATTVATNLSVPVEGESTLTIPAETLSGNVTLRAELFNASTDSVEATTLVNLTATTTDSPPIAAGFVPTSTSVNQTVTLDGGGSFDDGTLTAFEWTVVAPNGSTTTYTGEKVGFTPTRTGSYEVSLTVTDDSGQTDNETWVMEVTAAPAVVNSSVTHVGGTAPDMANVSLRAEFSSGLLQVQLRNKSHDFETGEPGGSYELAGLGADETTRIRVNVTTTNFLPRVLIGSAHNVTWSRTRTASGNWTVSITGSPAEVHSYFNQSTNQTTWDGTKVATQAQNQTITYAVDSLAAVPSEYRQRMNGTVMLTDAQSFGSPRYNATATRDRIELYLAAPHYEVDGETINEGFFEAQLPPSLLDSWGVTATELVATYNGTQRAATVTSRPDGGANIAFNVTYSDGNVGITYEESTSGTGDGAANFTASIDSTTAPVVAGEPLDVTAVIENVGNVSGTQTVTLTAGGALQDSQEVSLAAGANETVTLSWTPSAAGDYTATVGTENDTVARQVTVTEPSSAFFEVAIESTTTPVVAGEDLRVNVTVTNTGDATGTQSIVLSTGAGGDSRSVEVAAGASEQVTLTWNTSGVAAGEYTATVSSEDDSAGQVVSVQAAVANLSVVSTGLSNSTLPADGSVNVTVAVENTGTIAGSKTVVLAANGTQLTEQQVNVTAGATETVNFTLYPETFADAGKYEITVDGEPVGLLAVEDSDGGGGETGGGTPGFGVGTALVAVLLASLWARRE